MADLDTIILSLDRIVVSGKLTTGQATIVLNHVTLRQMLDKVLEARDLVEPRQTPDDAVKAIADALRAGGAVGSAPTREVSGEAFERAVKLASDGDILGAQKAILDDLTRQHLSTFIGRPPDWRKVEQIVDRACEFCGKPMLVGDTVYRHAVEPNVGAKMCFRCFLELKPNG